VVKRNYIEDIHFLISNQ